MAHQLHSWVADPARRAERSTPEPAQGLVGVSGRGSGRSKSVFRAGSEDIDSRGGAGAPSTASAEAETCASQGRNPTPSSPPSSRATYPSTHVARRLIFATSSGSLPPPPWRARTNDQSASRRSAPVVERRLASLSRWVACCSLWQCWPGRADPYPRHLGPPSTVNRSGNCRKPRRTTSFWETRWSRRGSMSAR